MKIKKINILNATNNLFTNRIWVANPELKEIKPNE